MRDTFSFANPRRGNTRQTQRKSLETKLAILLQGSNRSATNMRHPTAELSLFSATGTRKYLTSAERERFLQAIKDIEPLKRLFCTVLLWSGGRVSEILALTPETVDADLCSVALLTLKRRRKHVVRQIPLPPEVMRELDAQFDLGRRLAEPRLCRERLWPWSRTTAWRVVKEVMQRASITTPAASPKGLRHTFGVAAFEAAVPPHLVQRWLGHASLRTTSIYGDVLGDEERRFAERMWDGRHDHPTN
ncbi:site-specific integrase [Bradyrhizobium brasilense]|uniref:tyrosine-type recombinase/integrase n=1 Tax=Bradyrhizobium brasilense TaxID=1419277 RepID=UPI0024B1B733|nr:site-specific integrase [Bradyrhizobium australafricanum]WFU32433.1 site-specific integrase [Bradyrhizobium australafricanum]